MIWLNGGPGCSSEDGALMEIGPYRLKDKETLEYNPGSWDEFANIMFVDNPVGTGFSYVDTNAYLHDLPEMADQFVVFLEKWFELFPEYSVDDVCLLHFFVIYSGLTVCSYTLLESLMLDNIFLTSPKPYSNEIRRQLARCGI